MARILAACLVLATLTYSAAAVGNFEVTSTTTYQQLAPVAGQWDIALAITRTADKSVFEQQICKEDKVSAACNKPLLTADAKDKLQLTATLKDGATQLKTIDNLQPKKVFVKACYSKPSTADRPWRKANDVIDKDKSCPFIVKSSEFTANSTTVNVEWPIPKNMTKAAWFAAIYVQCQNGTDVAWCQTDSTKNATYFGTNIINSTPTGMIIATAVCSAIGPLFLASYFLKDFLNKGKQ
eukprot:GHUV01002928.1.p1 GENE.GHUV01002928.1~~GHUV01002928.1.p1  ORF type:complete len:265 (+),score=73.35 GHUV01002928.1:83-796(+)